MKKYWNIDKQNFDNQLQVARKSVSEQSEPKIAWAKWTDFIV